MLVPYHLLKLAAKGRFLAGDRRISHCSVRLYNTVSFPRSAKTRAVPQNFKRNKIRLSLIFHQVDTSLDALSARQLRTNVGAGGRATISRAQGRGRASRGPSDHW
jgi:hypothetical protein